MVVLSWNAPWVIFCLRGWWYFPGMYHGSCFTYDDGGTFHGMHHESSFAYDDGGTFLECSMEHHLLTMMVVLSLNATWVIFCLRWWWYFPGMHHGSSFAYGDGGTFHVMHHASSFSLRWWWYFTGMHHGSSFAYDDGGNFLQYNMGHLLHHGHQKTSRGRGCVTKQAIHSPISCLVMALLFSQRSLNRPASRPSPSRTHRKFRASLQHTWQGSRGRLEVTYAHIFYRQL